MRILIKGAGDLATGLAQALYRAGMHILMTEMAQPLAVRRSVALAQAVLDGQTRVEDMEARLIGSVDEAQNMIESGVIPVLVDAELRCLREFKPHVLIEATVAKKNIGLHKDMAPLTIALGPGFYAGRDAHVVIETMRGHDLGRLIYEGTAMADTGEPGLIAGEGIKRLLRATGSGPFAHVQEIGDMVEAGQTVAYCGETPLIAGIGGCLRGLLQHGVMVHPGLKVGDIDPRGERKWCFSISEKARALGGATLVAVMQHFQKG